MAINFVVETGTADSTSTSYASIANYRQYWLDRGETVSSTDDQIKGYLNIATEWIDNNFVFLGDVVKFDQALSFPRYDIYDKNGDVLLSSTTIPGDIIKATCYMAKQASEGLLNKVDNGVKSESYGPVSKTYSTSSTSFSFPTVDKLLKWYVASGSKGGLNMIRVN